MNKNTNIFDRILELAESKGIKNVPDLAVFLGYDSPEKLYRLKRKPDAKPSFDMLEDLTNKFESLNLSWLVTGSGKMELSGKNYDDSPTLTLHESAQEHSYSASTPSVKSGTKTKKAQLAAPATAPPTKILLPQIITVDNNAEENILHVSLKVAAGYVEGLSDPEYLEKLPSFRLPGLNNGSYRSFEVDGDSMFPTLKSGEMVIGEWLEKLDYIREDRVHILVLKQGRPLIKRLLNRISTRNVIIAKSDATNNRGLYKNIEINPDDVLEVWYARFHGGFDFQSPSDMWNRVNNHEADLTILQNQVDKLLDVVKSAGLIKE